MLISLLAATESDGLSTFLQFFLTGLTTGALYALIALGYSMVYGIIELINFAHGDLFMLGAALTWSMIGWLGLAEAQAAGVIGGIALMLLVVPLFCATINVSVDRIIYRPLRSAPKLAPLVSAIGVSFIFMNVGLFWIGDSEQNVPNLIGDKNLLGESSLKVSLKNLVVMGVTLPVMILLTLFVKRTKLGTAMRATAQNPVAARLMGINADRVISATFAIGGALAGVASVIYALTINTVGYQMGFQTGLFAFTAAVLGGIGSIPGAVLGGILIGLVKDLGSGYVDQKWNTALIFLVLIGLLVFRPAGILGSTAREKV